MATENSFTIYLEPVEEDGSGQLRIGNLPIGDPGRFERMHMHERTDVVPLIADLTEVVHGKLSGSGEPATLVVMDFWFLSSEKSRRFTKATIDVSFRDADATPEKGPWVIGLDPVGKWQAQPSEKHVEMTRSANASAQAGSGPASMGAGVACDYKTSQNEADQITVNGMKLFDGTPIGHKRKVRWVLTENRSQSSGLPSQFRTFILVQRCDNEQFTAVVDIDAHVNLSASVLRMFGRKPKDDPIIFEPDPEVRKERKLTWAKEAGIDPEKLGEGTIAKQSFIVYANIKDTPAAAAATATK